MYIVASEIKLGDDFFSKVVQEGITKYFYRFDSKKDAEKVMTKNSNLYEMKNFKVQKLFSGASTTP